MMASEEKYQKLIAKCWADPAFQQSLFDDPRKILMNEGWHVPDGLTVIAMENTQQIFHLVIPVMPKDVSDEDLAGMAGAGPVWLNPNPNPIPEGFPTY